MSAKYCRNLDLDFLGMTGKFHTTWGEFGGYKHPNALRYECAAMLAFGAKCSVGDQLHPSGRLDESTYELIGSAYKEVEEKEPWCEGARNVADVGLLSGEAINDENLSAREEVASDIGAGRVLLDGQVLFDVLDAEMDFSPYKALVLADDVSISPELKSKLDAYLAEGGKLMLSGASGLREDGSSFLFDIGAEPEGESEFSPDYVLPREDLRPDFCSSPFVMYLKSQRIKVTDGESMGEVYDPYFNRTYKHFCSHQHAPARPAPSGYAAGSRKGNILYLAHPVFSIYRFLGAVAYKAFALNALKHLLEDDLSFESNLPSSARVALAHQPEQSRYVLHLLHASPLWRGGEMKLHGGNMAIRPKGIEVIEDLLPLHDIEIALRVGQPVLSATLEPQGTPITFDQSGGTIRLKLDRLACHQMIAFQC